MTEQQQAYIVAYLAIAYSRGRAPGYVSGPDGNKDFDGSFDVTAGADRAYLNDDSERITIDVYKNQGRFVAFKAGGYDLEMVFADDDKKGVVKVTGGVKDLYRIDVSGSTVYIDNQTFRA